MTIYLLTCLQAHSLSHQGEGGAGIEDGGRSCTAAKSTLTIDSRQRFKRTSKMDADRLCVLHAQLQLQQQQELQQLQQH